MHREADQEHTRALLALIRTPGLGASLLGKPLLAGVDAIEILRQPGHFLSQPLAIATRKLDWSLVDQDLTWLEGKDTHLIAINDPLYPETLRQTQGAPAALFVKGDPGLLNHPQLAIVGSRNPTQGGIQNALDFAEHLSRSGIGITSGLALGIDSAAHRGALKGSGLTVAVLGTGLDRVYPAQNLELAHEIAARGALVTEFPLGTGPKPGHFPRRNRIISGLALGTLVVEAALESGSLLTARLAADQSREVFAIPGSIHNPMSRGCHALIRQGAKLVESAQDILEELTPALSACLESPALPTDSPSFAGLELDQEYLDLLEYMGHDPISLDALAARSGQPVEAVSSMLLLLEMEAHVSSAAGGLFCRMPRKT